MYICTDTECTEYVDIVVAQGGIGSQDEPLALLPDYFSLLVIVVRVVVTAGK
jgi:hypothetical protein